MPDWIVVAFTVGAFWLGMLVGYSQGARSTARRIACMILFREDIEISERAKLSDKILEEYSMPKWVVKESRGYTIALDTDVTPDLYLETIANDIIHWIQIMRRLGKFKLDEYIVVEYKTCGKVLDAIEVWRDKIMEETRATYFTPGEEPHGRVVHECRVGGKNITLWIDKDPFDQKHIGK
jgi:hypothetical protein